MRFWKPTQTWTRWIYTDLTGPTLNAIISLVAAALQIAGVISMEVAYVLLLLAWVTGISSIFSRQPEGETPPSKAVPFMLLSTILLFCCFIIWRHSNPGIKYTGILTPSLDSLQPSSPLLPPRKRNTFPALEIGDSCSYFFNMGEEGKLLIEIVESSFLTIESIDGQIKVSTKVFNQDGHVVANLDRNIWEVARPPTSYKFNYTDEALEVIDARDRVILQVRVLPDRVQLQGEWWNDKGQGVRIAKSADRPEPSTVWLAKGEDRFLKEVPPIQRIFKYPAEDYLGETLAPLPQAPPIDICLPLDATQRTITTPWFPLPEFPAPKSGLHGRAPR